MQISLSLRLDTARDRFVVTLEQPAEGDALTELPIKVEGLDEPVLLQVSPNGTIKEIQIPGLSLALAAIAGEGKPGKPGKPAK